MRLCVAPVVPLAICWYKYRMAIDMTPSSLSPARIACRLEIVGFREYHFQIQPTIACIYVQANKALRLASTISVTLRVSTA